MAILGLGTDIVEISRFDGEDKRLAKLAQRVLTPWEHKQFSLHTQPVRYLAKRFAAKEAAAKALGTGIGRGVSFQQIEVKNHESGAPYLVVNGEFSAICQTRGIVSLHLSLSDEVHYAVATVILEGE